jgi:hypothetical protein
MEDKQITATRGVKLKNKNAEKAEENRLAKENMKNHFSQTADKAVEYAGEKQKRAVEVISRFFNLTKDKTLVRNRGGISSDVEQEIRQDLCRLALDFNNDESEADNGSGSVIAISILLKIILAYRDRINELEFKVENLERNVKKASS